MLMPKQKIICIISNNHSTGDVRLYHKLGKSLCKLAKVYVIGAGGVGSVIDDYEPESGNQQYSENQGKPIRIIASGFSPMLRLVSLYNQARKLKPDLVICIEPLTLLVGLRLRRVCGVKLCYDAHEYYSSARAERYSFPLNYLFGGMYYLFEHILQEKMNLTIAVNDDIFNIFNLTTLEAWKKSRHAQKSLAEQYLKPPSRLGVICPNYPTEAIFRDDLASCGISNLLPDTQFDTVYLGGLTEERGIMKLLRSIQILSNSNSQFKALFVGHFHTDAFHQKFFKFLMDNNLNSNVFWRDSVPHDKVCAILRQVKTGFSVLHPRYKRYRNALPLKVLEYLSVGIPVVANDFPILKRIIEKYNVGICVPFHAQDIAIAVQKLLAISDSERDSMAERCRATVRENFLWSKVEPALLEAVSYVLEPLKGA
jgi:glycosyltransferase involved in cell wall biosynthesis